MQDERIFYTLEIGPGYYYIYKASTESKEEAELYMQMDYWKPEECSCADQLEIRGLDGSETDQECSNRASPRKVKFLDSTPTNSRIPIAIAENKSQEKSARYSNEIARQKFTRSVSDIPIIPGILEPFYEEEDEVIQIIPLNSRIRATTLMVDCQCQTNELKPNGSEVIELPSKMEPVDDIRGPSTFYNKMHMSTKKTQSKPNGLLIGRKMGLLPKMRNAISRKNSISGLMAERTMIMPSKKIPPSECKVVCSEVPAKQSPQNSEAGQKSGHCGWWHGSTSPKTTEPAEQKSYKPVVKEKATNTQDMASHNGFQKGPVKKAGSVVGNAPQAGKTHLAAKQKTWSPKRSAANFKASKPVLVDHETNTSDSKTKTWNRESVAPVREAKPNYPRSNQSTASRCSQPKPGKREVKSRIDCSWKNGYPRFYPKLPSAGGRRLYSTVDSCSTLSSEGMSSCCFTL